MSNVSCNHSAENSSTTTKVSCVEAAQALRMQVVDGVDATKNDFRLRFREFHRTGFDEQLDVCADAIPNVLILAGSMPFDLTVPDLEAYLNIHWLAACAAAGEDWAHLDGIDPFLVESELPRQILHQSTTFQRFAPTERHCRINALGYERLGSSNMQHDLRLAMAFRVYIMGFAYWHGASEYDLAFIAKRITDLRWVPIIRGDIKTAIEELL